LIKLEYYTAMFYIMVWANRLEDRAIHAECGNTAEMSWLKKSRANGGNAVADEAHERVVVGQLCRNSSRRDACRNLLFYLVTKPERMHGRE